MNLISIVIPARNEQATLGKLLNQVANISWPKGWESEVIIVNDASSDNTAKIATAFIKKHHGSTLLTNASQSGKTQSVKKGILKSNGDLVIIQDADLEYDPHEIPILLDHMLQQDLDVVYGNRFGYQNKVIYHGNYFGNRCISAFSNLFTYFKIWKWIPDMEVCYKLMDGKVARELAQTISATSNFGFEPEITAKLSRYKLDGKHLRFGIVPIHYNPRTMTEGKKLKAFQDGWKAIKEIIYYNIF